MKNIVLIGMPGVGKSTAGVVLAKVLGYEFIDADLIIQQQEGKLLREIIAEVGTDGFIEVENRVNSQIEVEKSVIATGGSVVYGKEAMQHLREIGTVVYLKVSYDILEKRLHDIKGRGVVLKDGQDLRGLYPGHTVEDRDKHGARRHAVGVEQVVSDAAHEAEEHTVVDALVRPAFGGDHIVKGAPGAILIADA